MSEITNEDTRTSSVAIKQSAKGDWYCEQIKIYFDKDKESDAEVMNRLVSLKTQVEQQMTKQ